MVPDRAAGFSARPGTPERYSCARQHARHHGTRARFGAHALAWAALLFAGNLVAATAGWRGSSSRGRIFREGIVLLVAMAGLAFAVCALSRQLYAYYALVDLLLIADAGWIVQNLEQRRAERAVAPETS